MPQQCHRNQRSALGVIVVPRNMVVGYDRSGDQSQLLSGELAAFLRHVSSEKILQRLCVSDWPTGEWAISLKTGSTRVE